MKREEHEAEINALEERQRAIWMDALPQFLEMRSCMLGLCGQIEAVDDIAVTSEDEEVRRKATARAKAMRAQRERPFEKIVWIISQLEIAKEIHRRRADGLL